MSKKFRWALGILIALGLVIAVNAAGLYAYHLPLVYNDYPLATPTRTSTPTKTSAPTKTPTPTSTPKPGQCLTGKTSGLCITSLDYNPKSGGSLNESISIKNLGSSAVDIEGWRILNDKSEKYDIPKFSLNANSTVKVWTKVGTDDSSNLYMDLDMEFWNNSTDCAYLRDDSRPRKTIDAICYGFDGTYYVPRLDISP
jgi:hypothetical protein